MLDVGVDAHESVQPVRILARSEHDTAAGGTDYFLGRRPVEGGPRIFKQDVNTWYIGGGFRGEFAMVSRNFYWDVNAAWSRNHADQTTNGSYNARKIKEALGPAGVDPWAIWRAVCLMGWASSPIPFRAVCH